MVSEAVVSVLLVCGVLVSGDVRGREVGDYPDRGEKPSGRLYDSNHEPFRGHYPRTPARKSLSSFDFSDPRPQDTTDLHATRGEREEEPLDDKQTSRRDRQDVYPVFIPVRFDLNRNSFSERSLAPDGSRSSSNSPRLIMDKDFNIRFDNPYIMPLTKPLALVLDSAARSREDGAPGEKLMIPFPVLVKARAQEGYRDYRESDYNAEHRSNDDDYFVDDTQGRSVTRKGSANKKRENETTTYRNTNYIHRQSGPPLSPEDQRNPEVLNPKSASATGQSKKEIFDDDSQDFTPSDVYPGKIFAEMYQQIPKYPDSTESQELEVTTRRRYPEPVTTPKEKPQPQPLSRVRTSSRYLHGSHVFSPTTKLEWVTHPNSSKARSLTTDDQNSGRLIIHEVDDKPATTTTRPQDVTISEKYWREI